MFKYAFIANSQNLNPKNYNAKYDNDEFSFYIAATNNFASTKETAKELAQNGFELIDLCGDFDAGDANKIASVAGIKVCYAKYVPEEMYRVDALDDLSEYGIIVMADGINGTIENLDLKSDELHTRVKIVGSDEDASTAAKELVSEGVYLIELCSYFDVKKAKSISIAIDGAVPVGYCG